MDGTLTLSPIGRPDLLGRSVAEAQVVRLNWCIVVRSSIHMILLVLRIASTIHTVLLPVNLSDFLIIRHS